MYTYKNKNFIIKTYPFKIYEIDKKIKDDEILKFIETIKDKAVSIQPSIYYLPLFIGTTKCNFKCKYCYAHEGTYGEKTLFMDKKTIDNTVNFLVKKMENSKSIILKKEIELGAVFFGGESLLHFEGLKHLVKSMEEGIKHLNKKTKIKFKPLTIVNTNGSVFSHEIMDFLNDHRNNIEVVVSFDGLHHDKYRLSHNHKPTSKIVINGINALRKNNISFSITCCIPQEEIEDVDENIKYITGLFGKNVKINISFIRGPILNVKRKAVYPGILEKQYTTKSLEIFGNKVAKLIHDGYKIYVNRFLNRVKEGGYLWRCPASLYEFCVYTNGSVYPCHNFIDDEFKMGNINDVNFNPSENKEIVDKFKSRNIDNLKCKDCVFQTVCLSSFDCPSHSLYDLGDFYEIDERTCIAAKKIMEALLEKTYLEGV